MLGQPLGYVRAELDRRADRVVVDRPGKIYRLGEDPQRSSRVWPQGPNPEEALLLLLLDPDSILLNLYHLSPDQGGMGPSRGANLQEVRIPKDQTRVRSQPGGVTPLLEVNVRPPLVIVGLVGLLRSEIELAVLTLYDDPLDASVARSSRIKHIPNAIVLLTRVHCRVRVNRRTPL